MTVSRISFHRSPIFKSSLIFSYAFHFGFCRYYRLWIYTCNAVLLMAVIIFCCVAGKVLLADYRRLLIHGLNLGQPSFVYAYLALLIQSGKLDSFISLSFACHKSVQLTHYQPFNDQHKVRVICVYTHTMYAECVNLRFAKGEERTNKQTNLFAHIEVRKRKRRTFTLRSIHSLFDHCIYNGFDTWY